MNEKTPHNDTPKKSHRKVYIVIAVLVAIFVAFRIGFVVFVSDYYHADSRAMAAMESTESVQVKHLDNGDIAFVPQDPETGIVFYPGGKVQAEAYAPLMNTLAERGFLGVIVPMPFNLAVFNINGADDIQQQFPDIETWVLMGHSLGGSMAATYADGHDGQWAGLVLLAAYSTADLTDNDIDVLCVRGENDKVLNEQAYHDNWGNLSGDAVELVIPGGNHAQFGNYGEQSGDGWATIPSAEQQEITADEIAAMF